MILGLDHIVIAVRDLNAAVADYTTLLNRAPSWRSRNDGAEIVSFGLDNTAVELISPVGEGATADRLRAILDERGDGLTSLAFEVDGIERTYRRLSRLGLAPEEIADGESTDAETGAQRSWKRTRATQATHGMKLFFLEGEGAPISPVRGEAAVTGLDHVVILTPDAERAAALYGARLGLDMRLDRTNPDWGMRLMFFRCGDLIVEIAHPLKAGVSADPDKPWGLSWRVADVAAAQARLAQAGFDVSEVRVGRKPGTSVFTVRNRSGGVPTLMVGPATP